MRIHKYAFEAGFCTCRDMKESVLMRVVGKIRNYTKPKGVKPSNQT